MSELETEEEIQPETMEVIEPERTFEEKVEHLVALQIEDPTVSARMLAEIYIFVNEFERAQRTMMEAGGPMAMLKMFMGGKG